MVEYSRDTRGPSPLLKGRELRKWTLCANAGDLTDIWLEALKKTRPWYTRQTMYGNRLDQAWLDRCNVTNMGEWICQLEDMNHDGSSSLADHIPIRAYLVLEGERRSEGRKLYFKMEGSLLKKEEVMTETKRVWVDHPAWANDDRKRWGLALARALANARRREQVDTRMSRIRCRIKWLKDGDAPSRFFYACLKAKNKKEEITLIKLDTGEVITEEGRILQLIEETYGELYTADEEGPQAVQQGDEVLQLVDKRLTGDQNRQLEETPEEELIEEIVRTLPQEKSLGFDGVTAEVLLER
ncbi:hypothetical protein R1sor_013407 [Riccia sorocarpa]|uniref:Uncharacterized protein n=1 Tax=Riccia sorocarpa TaxID=122646 RepID=A0ABD3H732_9MARC